MCMQACPGRGRALLVGAAALFAVCLVGCRGNSGTIPGGGGGGNNTGGNNCTSAETCKTLEIGGHVWLAENLVVWMPKGSWCYGEGGQVYDYNHVTISSYVTISSDEVDANCAKYGRLYTYDAAVSACKQLGSGWHLPTREEWQELVRAVDPNAELIDGWDYGNVAGTKLKSVSGWYDWDGNNSGNGTDEFGFSALPGGYRYANGSFDNAGNYGYWWTASEYGSSYAYSRFMRYDDGDYVNEDFYDKGNGFSVRCRGD